MDAETIERLKGSVQVDVLTAENGGYELPTSALTGATPGEHALSTSEERPGIHPSVIFYMPAGEPPRALITDESGRMLPKIISYLDLLYMLEESVTIQETSRDPEQTTHLPPLPEGAMLVTMNERLSGSSYAVTGVLPPEKYTFPVDRGKQTEIFEVPLPHVAYHVVWDAQKRTISRLSITVLSPEHRGPITTETEVYCYPFSNTYGTFHGTLEGVCWPVGYRTPVDLKDIPDALVRGFFASPNDADRYTRDVQALINEQGAQTYESLLDKAEKQAGIRHDWLTPAAMNIQQLHDQKRRDS